MTKRSIDLENTLPRLAGDTRLVAVIFGAAILQQALSHLNGDDSWFLTFAEKYHDGLVPYVQVTDPNPPASFLSYLPAVWISRALAIAPEPVLAALTFLAAAIAILFTGAILRKANLLGASERGRALVAATYVLLFVPAFSFAEREHIAVLAMLPFIAVRAARAAGEPVSLRDALLAGLACGISCAFKPYYVVPAGCVALYSVISTRKPVLLFAPEMFAAAAVVMVYFAAVVSFFPAYFSQAIPLIADIYVPLRDTPLHVLASPFLLANVVLLAALVFVSRFTKADPRTIALEAASFGFALTFLIQGKGWVNHAYPGIALALLAAASFLSWPAVDASATSQQKRRLFGLFVFTPILCAAPFLFGTMEDFAGAEEYPGLAAAVSRVAPLHPKVIALAEQLDIGHPLVRQVGGTWVGRQNCLWVSWGVRYILARGHVDDAKRARLLAHLNEDEAMFAEDVARGKPDVLLVESPKVEAWARTQKALAGIFEDYRPAATASGIAVWVRKEQPHQARLRTLQTNPLI